MNFELSAEQHEIKERSAEFADREVAPCAAGSDLPTYCLMIEEISRADAGVGVTLAVHTSAGTLPIVMYGSEDQKARWVPDLARGNKIGSFALTEPTTGSDAAAIKTTAERVDGGYRISGHKQWVTNGRVAGATIVFARTSEGP